MTMRMQNTVDATWTLFLQILSAEFTNKTGFGMYAYVTPVDVDKAYQDYQDSNTPMQLFVREYVRRYA
jgi:hypothetical protein